MTVVTHHHDGHTHAHEDLSYAGQGAVLLDIGGDFGALILQMPADLDGIEIEICPAGQEHAAAVRPHVAVLGRPAGASIVHAAVFPSLRTGQYELYRKSDGPTELTVEVTGGQVTETAWP
jgi:hypothetical protein